MLTFTHYAMLRLCHLQSNVLPTVAAAKVALVQVCTGDSRNNAH